jgi:hypothetical protein
MGQEIYHGQEKKVEIREVVSVGPRGGLDCHAENRGWLVYSKRKDVPHFQVDLERGFFAFDDYSVATDLEPFVLQNLLEARQVSILRRFQFSSYLKIAFLSELN